MTRKTLGAIIVEKGILSSQQLPIIEQEAHNLRIPLTQYLINNKLASEEQIVQCYADQLGVIYISKIEDEMADPGLLAKIPLKFLRENIIIPVKIHNQITYILSNPTNFQALDDLQIIFGNATSIALSIPSIIIDALNHYYPLEGTDQMIEDLKEENDALELSFSEIDEKDIMNMDNDAPIIKLVNYILFQADKMGASDIHIEPCEKELRVRYRVDGIMHIAMNPPKRIQGALSSRIKIMAQMDIAEKRKPQGGRIEIKIGDRALDIRVSMIPVKFGESIVLRLLDKNKGFGQLSDLGCSARDLTAIRSAIQRPNGIILVSGPTGSGKTSTLYAILAQLNTPTVNILTVEDPVEYQMHGVQQVQVNVKADLTFALALREILRQDPDIIMIGETRDQETAHIAIQAALTGHLVLSTIHTNSAPATITRLLDMNIEPFLISSSIVAVIAQRLVRKLCPFCKEAYVPSKEVLESLSIKDTTEAYKFFKPKGCTECNNLGYKGRLAIFEIMTMTDDLSKLTMERSSTTALRKQAQKDGMTLLAEDGIRQMQAGLTSLDEVISASTVAELN